MRSFQNKADGRRKVYLALSSSIEGQLREAFARLHEEGGLTQASVAARLGVNRSEVNRRLSGRRNMTIETVADMVWALGQCIDVNIFDPAERPEENNPLTPVFTEENEVVRLIVDAKPITASSATPIGGKVELVM